MQPPLPLADILKLESADFGVPFYGYLVDRKNSGEPLHPVEEEAWLVLTMQLDIEMEGFVDLFYQLYSLRECDIVEATLRKIGLHRLAELFVEAKKLYVGGRTDISQSEYDAIDPWVDTLGKNDGWKEFEAIDREIMAEGSEIYLVWPRMEKYVKQSLLNKI
jgi:hypothetical protein